MISSRNWTYEVLGGTWTSGGNARTRPSGTWTHEALSGAQKGSNLPLLMRGMGHPHTASDPGEQYCIHFIPVGALFPSYFQLPQVVPRIWPQDLGSFVGDWIALFNLYKPPYVRVESNNKTAQLNKAKQDFFFHQPQAPYWLARGTSCRRWPPWRLKPQGEGEDKEVLTSVDLWNDWLLSRVPSYHSLVFFADRLPGMARNLGVLRET